MFRTMPLNLKGNADKGREALEKFLDLAFDQPFNPKGRVSGAFSPFRIDCVETDAKYEIIAELPGFRKEEITVAYDEEHRLTISAEREENSDESVNYACRERRTGKLERVFYVDGIVSDQVSVSLENGLLRVTLPKESPEKGKKVFDIN